MTDHKAALRNAGLFMQEIYNKSAEQELAACYLERDAQVKELREALNDLKVSHTTCEDCWYSCPKSPDGCCDDRQGPDCNCGADEHNAKIDAALGDKDVLP